MLVVLPNEWSKGFTKSWLLAPSILHKHEPYNFVRLGGVLLSKKIQLRYITNKLLYTSHIVYLHL